jgi:hypothetical protein
MKTILKNHRTTLALLSCACIASTTTLVRSDERQASEGALLRLDDILWREVRNVQGEVLGGVSDLLVQMPSGRLVFVAVDPSELFERPKAVPPASLRLPQSEDAPLVLDISKGGWLEAPRLDWDGALVIKNTEEGGRIYGYYQQAWREPDPGPPWGMPVVAPSEGAKPPARYVSLKNLLLQRVETNGREHAGYIQGFLIDWSAKRATHALVSSQFTPLAQSDANWFAIPTPLLNPSLEDEGIMVNSGIDAFRTAPNWPGSGNSRPPEIATIYRYPVPARAIESGASRPAR